MNETRLTFGKRLDWTASALVLYSCQLYLTFFVPADRIIFFCTTTGSQSLSEFLFWFCSEFFLRSYPTTNKVYPTKVFLFAPSEVWLRSKAKISITVESQGTRRSQIERLS